MKREIKFRAKCYGHFVFGYYYYENGIVRNFEISTALCRILYGNKTLKI